MADGFFACDINVFLEAILLFLNVFGLVEIFLHIIVFRVNVFFHGIIESVIVSDFFDIVVSRNLLLLLISCGFMLFDLVISRWSFGVFCVFSRLLFSFWLWLTHKGFSGLGEFLLIQVPVFVFIK